MPEITKSDLIFSPTLKEYADQRRESFYTALAGPNNAGKSLVLKSLKHNVGVVDT